MNTLSTQDTYDHYSMRIQWSDADNAYLVTVPELPGCVTHGDSYEDAALHGREAIESWIAANRAWGRPIPAPQTIASA